MPVEKEGTGAGSVWTWTAIDADSKLIISYLCGGRDAAWAGQFMEDLASRVSTRIQITTDGHRAYAEAVEGAFGMEVDYAMLIKLYGSPSDNPETRYSPATCIGIRTGILSGNPDRNHISTSYVERQNLNLRMGVRRFTRLTNAFSKKFENHCHMVAIYHAYYNFCRVHQTLRVTPAGSWPHRSRLEFGRVGGIIGAIGRRSGGVTDWRVDLAKHTKGATLTLKTYMRRSEEWDHDHCEACTNKFSETIPGALREGYATPDNYRWICSECFNDLKEQMGWKLV